MVLPLRIQRRPPGVANSPPPRQATAALACLLLVAFLGACGPQDWRARRVGWAEGVIRGEVRDFGATFSHVQVTGDQKTGQVCGYVKPKSGLPVRFVVYIDGTSDPYVEGGEGKVVMEQDRFNFAWNYDCVGEGYTGQ